MKSCCRVEKIISKHYHETTPAVDDLLAELSSQEMSKTQMVLQSESWYGQENGERNSEMVHARHLRPLCNIIPSTSPASGSSVVLFMHYLHWETDKARTMAATAIKETCKAQLSTGDTNEFSTVVDQVRENEASGPYSIRKLWKRFNSASGRTGPSTENEESTLTGASHDLECEEHNSDSDSRLSTEGTDASQSKRSLGRLLLLAAKLAEDMNSHLDVRLLQEYLHHDPPLHPRRTLDQSYYGVLKNTQTRDQDQVVYRGTTPMPHWNTGETRKCPHNSICKRCIADQDHIKEYGTKPEPHWGIKESKTCPKISICKDCQTDVRKVSRVIMVDQLWMWILDECMFSLRKIWENY